MFYIRCLFVDFHFERNGAFKKDQKPTYINEDKNDIRAKHYLKSSGDMLHTKYILF